MKVVEYGEKQPQVVLLLHGGGLSWWSYREVAHRLQAHYHVVLPVLDGHAESGVPFVSIEENAARLICYIEERFGGAVLAAAGLSLGGQILAEMLAERKWICQYAVLESALVVPMRMTGACVGPIVRASYGLIRKMWFAKMQARALGIPESMFADYYRDTCALRETDMIRFMQANAGYQMKEGLADTSARVLVVAGGKERREIRRSARLLHSAIPNSRLWTPAHYKHGACSLRHPQLYAETLHAWIEGGVLPKVGETEI